MPTQQVFDLNRSCLETYNLPYSRREPKPLHHRWESSMTFHDGQTTSTKIVNTYISNINTSIHNINIPGCTMYSLVVNIHLHIKQQIMFGYHVCSSEGDYLFINYLINQFCNQINTTGATSRAGTAYPSGVPEFILEFVWGSCYSIFSAMCMFCRSVFALLYFFIWPLCCLFFFDLRILITPLVSSNLTYYNTLLFEKR